MKTLFGLVAAFVLSAVCSTVCAQVVDTEWTTADISNLLTYTSGIRSLGIQDSENMSKVYRQIERGRAQLIAELTGADTTWSEYAAQSSGQWLSSPGGTATTSGAGLVNTVARPTERSGIADGSKKSIWAQLDAIRLNTASGGGTDMTSTNALLTLINDALRAANQTEWLDYLSTQTVPRIITINDNITSIKNDFRGWEGSTDHARTWKAFADYMMEAPGHSPEVIFDGSDWDVQSRGVSAVQNSVEGIVTATKETTLPGQISVPSEGAYEESPPVFVWSVPLSGLNAAFGGSLTDIPIVVDTSRLPAAVFGWIKVVVICLATYAGMSRVWEEFRRYG